ncbi:MAG TPA: Gfo/Idh/MocA family oxidoreductase, partial [Bryobacteraceae bacterium]|nr:Gfo/Idh/MocA family oxidoreductase [Bryobacteraceae bacterium]
GRLHMNELTRRDFARSAGFASALSYSRILGANDRVRLGYIGLGNRGDQVHEAFLEHGDCQTVAVCDLRDDYMDLAVKKSRATPRKYKEYKKLLDDRDVDAVVIATPDHWHALMFIDACNAGKDVYVEKPLSLTVHEGRKMVETAERTKRVVQVGTDRRSWKTYKEAVDFVRSGGIGHVSVARCFHIRNEWPNGLGPAPDGPPPSEWEWDQWLGPAPKVPYNRNRTYYNFRWFYDYSGGQLTNFGVHYVDVIRWLLGQDSPRAVTALGGQYAGIRDNREIPDTLEVLWSFDGPTLVVFSQFNANAAPGNVKDSEIELRGTKGTMYIRAMSWEVVPERTTEAYIGYDQGKGYGNPVDRTASRRYSASLKPAMEPIPLRGSGGYDTIPHARNFLDCIKSRGKCNADILTGHLSTSATLIGNIALKTESHLKWDARAERFTNKPEANRFLQYQYRTPYKLI